MEIMKTIKKKELLLLLVLLEETLSVKKIVDFKPREKLNRRERYSRSHRLSDTRYSAKGSAREIGMYK